ncbi:MULTISPECIES: ABC transporter ATP-binding protein [unclassified Devosia]|uniref:ABC transporter ATP-binding protein n=1 Tax=unclassified Devosia TaxID=196773 RepID=UPI00086DF603|nr:MULTISPECIES: ABC transporter ATP-binding protein [unclassified Devosia]MBN9363305.1 ABC transporter ATP-binding protein [Devosia sp.]ODS83722.1 MAG: ABC transporter [Devosia sp. SCN 66-27]OJX25142.1 MAG: ABC transporter ATP-binding protein [Devosia sp. 66-14]
MTTSAKPHAIEVNNLVVSNGDVTAVRGVSFTIPQGGRMGLVGESGSGKSMTALALMGLLPMGWNTHGNILHDGVDLVTQSDKALSSRRGRTLSMVFQDPLSSLNPVRRVGDQISSVIRRHTGADRKVAEAQTIELIKQMNLPRPEQLVRAYPHEISGGQRQRIMIAMALACYPQLIIADEPTTALDVTVQKQVLRLLNGAVRDRGSALLMITHDLPIIAAMCDTVAVMYAGRIVEIGPVQEVFRNPRHHYTRGLLDSQPTMDNIALDGSSRLVSIPGMVPPLHSLPTGCAFNPRCPAATDKCRETMPELGSNGVSAACWHPIQTAGEVAAQ